MEGCRMATLFTRPDCPYCDAARQYLEDAGEDYVERDVTTDDEAAREVATITGGPVLVPITVRGDDVRVGFPYT